MKYKTEKIIGQQTYSISADMLGIKYVRVNGKKIDVNFYFELAGVPRKNGEIEIEIVKSFVKKD